MIAFLAATAAALSSPSSLDEAKRALAAGRQDQARHMVANAVAQGGKGPSLDRLLADLAFAEGDWHRALAGYKVLLASNEPDTSLLEQAGISALKAGALEDGVALLERAIARPNAGWQAWNARAVAADWQRDWARADQAYAKAASAAPANARILNNQGWSLALRGEWSAAIVLLEKATLLAPSEVRIAANVDLARSVASESLPVRRPGESGTQFASRLNDAGMAALGQGNQQKAVAAFSQALEASDHWFIRAANNLALVEGAR